MKNAAIVYLTRLNDLWILRHSIKFLFTNFNKEHNYPVVVFYDDLTPMAISSLLGELNADL